LKAKLIQFNSDHLRSVLVVEHVQNLDNYGIIGDQHQQKNYFLICESCFWMASTLNYFKSINNLSSSIYRECPLCENKIDQFTIPSDLHLQQN